VHLGSWRDHPLIKALLAQPLSQPSLLLGMQRILNAASQADARQPQQLLQQLLLPFVSFVLLQPDTQGDSTSLCMLHVIVVCGRWLFVGLRAMLNRQWHCVADECVLNYMQCTFASRGLAGTWLVTEG